MESQLRNQNISYMPVTGTVESLRSADGSCCSQQLSVRTPNGPATFITTQDTCFINNVQIRQGMTVIGYFDADAPAPLIYPPQYRILVIGQSIRGQLIKVDTFNRNLVSSDGMLRLTPGPSTQIVTPNNQRFVCSLAGRTLVVVYTTTTRSIPAQTTPSRIIVLC